MIVVSSDSSFVSDHNLDRDEDEDEDILSDHLPNSTEYLRHVNRTPSYLQVGKQNMEQRRNSTSAIAPKNDLKDFKFDEHLQE